MQFKNIFKQNPFFFGGYLIFLASAITVLLSFSKVDGHLFLNGLHTAVLDRVFIALTSLGDGLFVLSVAVVLFVFRRRYLACLIAAAYLSSGLLVQVIKFFYDAPRPAVFLKQIDYAYFIEGVTLHNYNSFPSGHTTSAFALATVLSIYAPQKKMGFLFLAMAIVAGYSRIYLSQHFLEDVVAGSFVGLSCAVLSMRYLSKPLHRLFTRSAKKSS